MFAAFLLFVLLVPPCLSADVSAVLRRQIARSVHGEEISVIVSFREPSGSAARNAGAGGRGGVARALRKAAARSQSGVGEMLRERGKAPRSLWIINSLAVEADADLIARLAEREEVLQIRPNAVIRRSAAEYAAAPVTDGPAAVGARELWSLGITGEGAVVAILDSGVEGTHPDLQPRFRGGEADWFNPIAEACGVSLFNCTPCEASAAEPCDDLAGLDQAHGTGVAGVAVGEGGIGAAPGAQWIAAKIFRDSGTATLEHIHAAFQWALDPDGDPETDDAPDVVNGSWGFDRETGLLDDEFLPDIRALRAAGIATVFAAGNGGGTAASISPGNYPETLAVGAVDADLTLADFSNQGPSATGGLYPTLVAPGVRVVTAGPSGGRVEVAGTSFAAPYVAGGIALLKSAFPEAPLARIESALTSSASDRGAPGPDDSYGFGMLNLSGAHRALDEGVLPRMLLQGSADSGAGGALDFGERAAGDSGEEILTFQNAGAAGLYLESPALSGAAPFSVVEDRCSGLLPPGAFCRIGLAFAPTREGLFRETLSIVSNDPETPLWSISLEGSGVNAPGNLPPSPPAALSEEVLPDGAAIFRWRPAADPDGDPLTYRVLLARTSDFAEPREYLHLAAAPALLGIGLAVIGLFPSSRRRWRIALACALAAAALALSSCGGGGEEPSSAAPFSLTAQGLAPGTWYWKVLAEDGRGGAAESAPRLLRVE